jgi:hypothetical protein
MSILLSDKTFTYMKRSGKYFLSFVAYAVSAFLLLWFESTYIDNLTPFRVGLSLFGMVVVYTAVLYLINKRKTKPPPHPSAHP